MLKADEQEFFYLIALWILSDLLGIEQADAEVALHLKTRERAGIWDKAWIETRSLKAFCCEQSTLKWLVNHASVSDEFRANLPNIRTLATQLYRTPDGLGRTFSAAEKGCEGLDLLGRMRKVLTLQFKLGIGSYSSRKLPSHSFFGPSMMDVTFLLAPPTLPIFVNIQFLLVGSLQN
jgi:hypothetical protein